VFVTEGEKRWGELGVHGADVVEKGTVNLVGEEGNRGLASNFNETLERVAGYNGTGRILGVAIVKESMVSIPIDHSHSIGDSNVLDDDQLRVRAN
jgi:hypothetical protein